MVGPNSQSTSEFNAENDTVATCTTNHPPSRGPKQKQPAKPRICLIGTSNAVFSDGYANEIAANEKVEYFRNYSVGFCFSGLLAYLKNSVNFAEYDICILELACNDGSLFRDGHLSADTIERIIREATHEIITNGCLPVIFILPIEILFPYAAEIRKIYTRLAWQLRLPIFDGYEFFHRLQIPNLRASAIFSDSMHLKRPIAREIAACFLDVLLPVWEVSVRNGPVGKGHIHVEGATHCFIGADDLACSPASGKNIRVTRRSTSLVSACVAELGDGISIELQLPDTTECIGLALDFCHTSGALVFEGASCTTVPLFSEEHYRNDSGGFVFSIMPIRDVVSSKNGLIRLRAIQSTEDTNIVKTHNFAQDGCVVALVGLIVRQNCSMVIRTMLEGSVDLCGIISHSATSAARQRILKLSPSLSEAAPTWTADEIVTALYKSLLGRNPDPSGLKTYTQLLYRCGGSIDGIVQAISQLRDSSEYLEMHNKT